MDGSHHWSLGRVVCGILFLVCDLLIYLFVTVRELQSRIVMHTSARINRRYACPHPLEPIFLPHASPPHPPTPPHLQFLSHTGNSHWLSILWQSICASLLLHRLRYLLPMSVSPSLPWRYVHQYHLSRFHICVLIADICLSLSDFLHSGL